MPGANPNNIGLYESEAGRVTLITVTAALWQPPTKRPFSQAIADIRQGVQWMSYVARLYFRLYHPPTPSCPTFQTHLMSMSLANRLGRLGLGCGLLLHRALMCKKRERDQLVNDK